MANVTLSQEDLRAAEAFLEAVLVEAFPDADYSRGSALRDHVINALAVIVGAMRGEATRIRYATSFDTIGLLEDPNERLAAAQALAANWFVTPRAGTRVRGVVTIHFTRRVDGRITPAVVFAKTAGLRFRLDQATDYTFLASDLLPNLDSAGAVTDYVLRVPVVAEFVGNAYAVSAGLFAATTPFSTALSFVENESAFGQATEPETAEELLARVPDAITVRDLNSARSITAVLQDTFSEITDVYVAGMGQPELRRDVYDLAGPMTQFHVGGATDVYVNMPVAPERMYQATVGTQFIDGRPAITAFKDPDIADLRTVVRPGDVLRIYNAGSSEPRLYLIETVKAAYLRVQERQPFSQELPTPSRDGATFNTGTVTAPNLLQNVNAQFTTGDVGAYIRITRSVAGNEGTYRISAVNPTTSTVTLDTAALVDEGTPNFDFEVYTRVVEYSIGSNAGAYDDRVSRRFTGEFTRVISEPGVIVLPTDPMYLIRSVSVLSPGDPDADPLTGEVTFPIRTNVTPTRQSGAQLEYQVEVVNPLYGHSGEQLSMLRVGWAPYLTGAQATLSGARVFTASSAVFSDSDVGATLRILNAFFPANRGEFLIESRLSATQVVLSNPRDVTWTPAAERRLSWEVNRTAKYDGYVCRVVYDTVAGFSAVSTFLGQSASRVSCASTLGKAYSPVYLGIDIRYRLKRNAQEVPAVRELRQAIVDFINAYPAEDTIDVSDIVAEFHNTNPDLIGSVELPMTIRYTLYAPDGRAIPYATQDAVVIDAAKSTAVTAAERLDDPLLLGVSDNTVRYLTYFDLITVTRVV